MVTVPGSCRFQGGEGASHLPEGQAQPGRRGHFDERRGEEEAGGARWAAAAETRGGRSQRPVGSRSVGLAGLEQVSSHFEINLYKYVAGRCSSSTVKKWLFHYYNFLTCIRKNCSAVVCECE